MGQQSLRIRKYVRPRIQVVSFLGLSGINRKVQVCQLNLQKFICGEYVSVMCQYSVLQCKKIRSAV